MDLWSDISLHLRMSRNHLFRKWTIRCIGNEHQSLNLSRIVNKDSADKITFETRWLVPKRIFLVGPSNHPMRMPLSLPRHFAKFKKPNPIKLINQIKSNFQFRTSSITDTCLAKNAVWIVRTRKDAYGRVSPRTDAYGRVSTRTDAYRGVRTPTDAYGRLRTRTDAYLRLRTLTDAYGRVRKPTDAYGRVGAGVKDVLCSALIDVPYHDYIRLQAYWTKDLWIFLSLLLR